MVDAFMFVTLVLEFFSELNNKIIRTFVSLGDEGLRLEYEYLSRMIGVSNKVVDGDQREVLHDLMSKTNLKVKCLFPNFVKGTKFSLDEYRC